MKNASYYLLLIFKKRSFEMNYTFEIIRLILFLSPLVMFITFDNEIRNLIHYYLYIFLVVSLYGESYLIVLSVLRMVSIRHNRHCSLEITVEQLKRIKKAYPKDTIYLSLNKKYYFVSKQSQIKNIQFEKARITLIGKESITDKVNAKRIIAGKE